MKIGAATFISSSYSTWFPYKPSQSNESKKKFEHYLLHEKHTCLSRLLFRTASSQVVYNLLKFFCHLAKLHSIQFKNQFETCMHHILYPPNRKLQFNSWLGLTGIWHTCAKKLWQCLLMDD